MRMADVFRALGMVDRDGKPFDETEIRRQVMASLGVSAPVIETGPLPKPPFRTWESCLQACLSLPVDPGDAEDFDRHTPETGALAVGAVLFLELTDGGLGTFVCHAGSAYALRAPQSLRILGLPEQAERLEAWLALHGLDAQSIDALTEDEPLPAEPETPLDPAAQRQAIQACAEAHPECFDVQ